MKEQSDTPETDAAEREDAGPITHARRGWNYSRKHERERDAAIREIGEQARLLGISGSREMALLAKVDSITRERDEARAEVEKLRSTFVHCHVRGSSGDLCAVCGLDLRDKVHTAATEAKP